MLPTRLIECTRDGDRLLPRFLDAADEAWVRDLLEAARGAAGEPVGETDDRVLALVSPIAKRLGASRRVVAAAWFVERKRWSTRIDAPVPPEAIRQAVFTLARDLPREEALAAAAAELGLRRDAIEAHLFADRARSRLLVPPSPPSTPAGLVGAYNLALVQALLVRATAIVAVVQSDLRRVVGAAKSLRLMATFEEVEGGLRLALSGPMALLHETVKYGRALARWFAALATTPTWSVEASVVLGQASGRLALDERCPIARAPAPELENAVAIRLERDLRRAGSAWRVDRDVDLVRARPRADGPPRLSSPDFALVSERGRVLVEIVGFWTPEYLAGKVDLLDRSTEPLVVCVDGPPLPAAGRHQRIVSFVKRIDPGALIRACESALEGATPV